MWITTRRLSLGVEDTAGLQPHNGDYDLADRRHDCDLLLDQNYGSSAERYAGLIPGKCTQFHGPKFALLKAIYAQRRTERSVHSSKIERVMIYFGGVTDPMDLTGMALRALRSELRRLSWILLSDLLRTKQSWKLSPPLEVEPASLRNYQTYLN